MTNPNQYKLFLNALSKGQISQEFKQQLALEAFEHTASYDIAISKWLSQKLKSEESPWISDYPIQQKLRYGENPHQKAIWYSTPKVGWGNVKQLQGKELSTNNLLDLEAAFQTVREFGYENPKETNYLEKAAVVIKHTNPCGVAVGESLAIALKRALDADRISAFGGIVALNAPVDLATAVELNNLFLECVLAPSFENKAREILSQKKNLRLLELNSLAINNTERKHIRSIIGGLLIQDQDDKRINEKEWKTVTRISPNPNESEDLKFAWKVVRHIRSNAIAVASNGQSLGIGAGQMNRVGAAKLALEAAGSKSKGAVLASDGFFPFDDTVRLAAKYGISAIIQPGGSIKDKQSIEACDELGIKMVLTGMRHFLH